MSNRLFVLLKERAAIDSQPCRTVGGIFLALSLTAVLPPVVIDLLRGGKLLKKIADILTGKGAAIAIDALGPLLVTFLLPAVIAAILGGALLLGIWPRTRCRCGKLLLWHVGFSIFMLLWPLLPIPWRAFGMNPAFASWLDDFSWSALFGLFIMEGYAVFLHVPVIVLLWCLSLFLGWSTIVQHGKEGLG